MTRTRLMNTTACALVLSVGGLSFSSEAWSFTQPNSASPAYIAGLNSQAAAGRAASAVTVAPKVTVVASGPSAAAKAASLVTIAAPAVTTAITSQALAGKAASQVTFASPATKIAQNIAAATPKGLLTPGKATPVYGPYDDSGTGTTNPYASLTDLQPANNQTFSNPSFAQGLTNLNFNQLSAANADPKNAITVDPTNPPKSMTPAPNSSASSKLDAAAVAGAAAGGAITNANGQTGAGSSLNSVVSAVATQILFRSELQGATANAGASDAPGGINVKAAIKNITSPNFPPPGQVVLSSTGQSPLVNGGTHSIPDPVTTAVNALNAQGNMQMTRILGGVNFSGPGGPLTYAILSSVISPFSGGSGGGFNPNPNPGGGGQGGGSGGSGGGGGSSGPGPTAAGDAVTIEGEAAGATGIKALTQEEATINIIKVLTHVPGL
jgi:hypothetical protein